MSITIDQAFQIFMADRETSCVDKTLMYYQENLTNFFTYVSGVFVYKIIGEFRLSL